MRVAIFASGRGSNAKNIIDYFGKSHDFLIITNNEDAPVVDISSELNVGCVIIDNKDKIISILETNHIEFIVLAGYIKLIPQDVVSKYQGKIINIHPSLLPKYGGKGMWGMNVHKSVIEAGEVESGCTIHYVSEKYDEGQIIEQHKCSVENYDSPETLFLKVHKLELLHFPKCIERLLSVF